MSRKFCALLVRANADSCFDELKQFFERNEGIIVEDDPAAIDEALKHSTKSILMLLKSPKFHANDDATQFSIASINDWTLIAFAQPGIIPALAVSLSKNLDTTVLGTDVFEDIEHIHFSNIRSGNMVSLLTQHENDVQSELNMNYKSIIKQGAPDQLNSISSVEQARKLSVSLLPEIMPVNIWKETEALLNQTREGRRYRYYLSREKRLALQLGGGSDPWEKLVAAAN